MRGTTLAVILGLATSSTPAWAQDIFKYVKPDGTITFTDNLSQLPETVRAEYNRKIAERDQQRAEQERTLGKEEFARREAEAERAKLDRENLEAADRAARMAAIEERIQAFAAVDARRQADKRSWVERVRNARALIKKLFADFQQAEATYNDLGTRASFSLLPGQAEQLEEAKKKMDALVPQLDAAIKELEVKIPDDARKAGIPPGWLREA